MPSLRPVDFRTLIRVFEQEGFRFNRQHGDHLIYTKAGVKRPLVIPMYGEGKLSLARAAREAGVSLWEMMDYARQRKIASQYDLEDFQRDFKTVSTRRTSR